MSSKEKVFDAIKSRPVKIVGTLLIIIAAYFIFKSVFFTDGQLGQSSNSSDISTSDVDMDSIIETYKTMDSDIEGKTYYDLYEMGLNPQEGADTDMDGLSDRDEIEIYGSDPTLYSTAGDLYSDKYKVENGLDVAEKVAGGKDQAYPYNSCSNIKLEADEAIEFSANVSRADGVHSSSDIDIYAEYLIALYHGDIEIDLSGILPEGVTADDVQLYISEFGNNDLDKVSADISGNTASLTVDCDSDSWYLIVGSKGSWFKNASLSSAFDSLSDERVYLVTVYGAPSFLNVPGTYIKIYANDLETEEETQASNQAIIDHINATKNITFVGNPPSVEIVSESSVEIYAKYKLLESAAPDFRQDRSGTLRRLAFSYFITKNPSDINLGYDYITKGTSVTDIEGTETEAAASDEFTIEYDTFPFINLKTEDYPGTCAGLSYLMAEIYNSDGADAIAKGPDGKWDLTKYEGTQTLLSRGVHDFKNSIYFETTYGSRSLKATDLINAPEDMTFYQMLTYYQQKCGCEGYCPAIRGGSYINYTTIDKMKALLDQGYALEVALYTTNRMGHMVIVYDYTEESDTVTKFKVYDCNFTSKELNYDNTDRYDFTISVEKIMVNGVEKFTFDYTPYLDNGVKKTRSNYRAYSTSDRTKKYSFTAYISVDGTRQFIKSDSEGTLAYDR